jgi:8-oxo-dGTP pyrophosphatase MutT (NUDIX family)
MRIFSPSETADYLQSVERRVSSAAAALYDERGRVLLVKATYKPYWTFPGGVIDASETPVIAAVRETKEEVGIDIAAESMQFYMVADRVSSVAHTYQFVFTQQIAAEQLERVVLDRNEIEDWVLVTREEILSGNRYYSQAALCWAENKQGYLEQQFSMR